MKKVGVAAANLSMSKTKITDSKTTICLFCRAVNPNTLMLCQNCHKILPATTDYFSKFGYEISFDIDLEDCNKRYLAMQSKVHPDLFVRKSEEERILALTVSSFLNDAYATLTDAYKRSLYILKLSNVDLTQIAKRYLKDDPLFLTTIWQLNETIEHIKTSAELEQLHMQITNQIDAMRTAIAAAFAQRNYHKAAIDTTKLKYYLTALAKVDSRI
jgi:molecular chaperone HscB